MADQTYEYTCEKNPAHGIASPEPVANGHCLVAHCRGWLKATGTGSRVENARIAGLKERAATFRKRVGRSA